MIQHGLGQFSLPLDAGRFIMERTPRALKMKLICINWIGEKGFEVIFLS
jgi:hypothetical protein